MVKSDEQFLFIEKDQDFRIEDNFFEFHKDLNKMKEAFA